MNLNLTKTLFVPTASFIYLIQSFSRLSNVKFAVKPATSNKNERKIAFPFVVKSTSGWNCNPYKRNLSLEIPATKFLDCAITRNVSATFSILSPCVKRTFCVLSNPLEQHNQQNYCFITNMYEKTLRIKQTGDSYNYT